MPTEYGFRTRPDLAESTKIKFTTEARGTSEYAKAAEEDRKARDAARAKEMATALAQPHRQGRDDPRLSEPLGRFCAAYALRDELWRAGNRYHEVLRQAKQALGFKVADTVAGGNSDLTDEDIEALRELALQRERDANAVLRARMPRLPRAMERFIYDALEPSIYDHDLLRDGLLDLAIHFREIDRGINEGKPT